MAGKVSRMAAALAALGMMMIVAAQIAEAQTAGTQEEFTAFAVNMGTVGSVGGVKAGTVIFRVERWSTPQERAQLISVLLEKGPKALLSALKKQKPVGYFRLPNSLGYTLRYAYQFPGEDGGRRIVIATDRRIEYWEARQQARTLDYPFTLIEIRLNKDGVGEGKMSVATKVGVDKDKQAIELENYSSEPVRLNEVKAKAKS